MKYILLILITISPLFSESKLHEGEIDGAKYQILSAEKPSGKVLLLAHGYRKKDQPLSAGFDTDGVMAKSLLADGWTIASTSYRRNGWIIDDALTDLRSLQDKVAKIQGKPAFTLVIGNSMGGQIAVLAAEGGLKIDGAITTGAALQDYPKRGMSPKITFAPKVPVILLINQEANRPLSVNYQKKAGDKLCALWKIERPGHCNVSDVEKLSAIRALEDWKAGKEVARHKDATAPIPDHPSTATQSGSSLIGKASHVSGSWGNITTTFVNGDLKKLGVELQDKLIVSTGEKSQILILARHYNEVPQGKGAAFLTPEGYLRVQLNGGSLAKKLGVEKDAELTLGMPKKDSN